MLSVIGKVNKKLQDRLVTDSDAPYHGKTLKFTSVSSRAPDVFPTLAVASLGEPSFDRTVELGQESIISTVEIRAYTNSTLNDASKLLDKAGDVMLSMFYDLYFSETLSDSKPYCIVARFRRKVGNSDFLY